MREAREVYGDEAREARLFCNLKPSITLHEGSIVFYRCYNTEEPREMLQVGWYEVNLRYPGVVLHWTRKSDMLQEVAALLTERD